MRYEFGGLVFGGAYFRDFTVYYISLLSFTHRITYVELEITFFDCLKTLTTSFFGHSMRLNRSGDVLGDKESSLHHILVSDPKRNNHELGCLKGTDE